MTPRPRMGDSHAVADGTRPTKDLDRLRCQLADHVPTLTDRGHTPFAMQAATAVVVAPGSEGLSVLIIERARQTNDRWSGHMALPGGRRAATDVDLAQTAARETHEEVGVLVDQDQFVARLDDQRGRSRPIVVASFVFALDEQVQLEPEPAEVAAAWWLPLSVLTDRTRTTWTRNTDVPFPAITYEGRLIYGLTHRTLASFAAALGLRIPEP